MNQSAAGPRLHDVVGNQSATLCSPPFLEIALKPGRTKDRKRKMPTKWNSEDGHLSIVQEVKIRISEVKSQEFRTDRPERWHG